MTRTTGGDPDSREGDGGLEDAASVLREHVDLGHSLLDAAELEEVEEPSYVAEDLQAELDEEEAEEAEEAESVLRPHEVEDGDGGIDPEELEERLESASEAAELLSLHDEGASSGSLADLELSLEGGTERRRRGERRRASEPAGALARAIRRAADAPAARRSARGAKIDPEPFRRRLEEERSRLEELVAGFEDEGLRERTESEDLSSLSSVDQHPADQGTETFDRERDLSIREQVEGELAQVASALSRLESGTYGRCEACGRPIGLARLRAEPAARLCVADQRELERELALGRQGLEP